MRSTICLSTLASFYILLQRHAAAIILLTNFFMKRFNIKSRLLVFFILLSIAANAQINSATNTEIFTQPITQSIIPSITQTIAQSITPTAAQIKMRNPLFGKYDWIVYTSQYLAGAADGTREQVLYHPNQIFCLYPHLNRQWWDSRISWRNKLHESPLAVEFSDANHFFESASRGLSCVSVAFSLGDWNNCKKQQRWLMIGKKILFSYIANKLGFITSYHVIFQNKLYL
jgi:hypothetical protein